MQTYKGKKYYSKEEARIISDKQILEDAMEFTKKVIKMQQKAGFKENCYV